MSTHLTQCDSEKEVQEGNQLRTAIMDSVTHELRTPLTSIKAPVTALLTNSHLQPAQRNDLPIVIDEEADRLNQLVGEAVETAQLDAVKLNLKPHAIGAIIDPTREECRPLLGLLPRISAGLTICKSTAKNGAAK
jgi:two-component system, OmpR family, sensor histidine kinase KdpD